PYEEGLVCYTSKGENTIYAICLPGEGEKLPGEIVISGIEVPSGSLIEMLGTKGKLKWRKKGDDCIITVPAAKIPSELAFALKISRPAGASD
ncbi:MAG: hypothetical protein KFF49_03660, partial [Bacteroidales bacterium]|nr:hypothetical protein [Bacteroidales bacterium]